MSVPRCGFSGAVFALGLLVLPASSRPALAYPYPPPPPYPAHTYYLTYSGPQWKETPAIDLDQAQALMARLTRFGAEAHLMGQGVAVDDPEFPSQVFRMVSVRYRLPTPKELVTLNLWKAQRWQAELQSLGFDVALGVDAPTPAPGTVPPGEAVLQTQPAEPAPARLPSHSVWTGVISQEGKPLPAQLILDRTGNKFQGELSFRVGDRPYRARVRGTVQGNTITFTSYEALEGRVFIPTEYEAALEGATMKGTWTYAPEQLQGNFELSLSKR